MPMVWGVEKSCGGYERKVCYQTTAFFHRGCRLETLRALRFYDFSDFKKSGTHLLYTYLVSMSALGFVELFIGEQK